MVGGMVKYPRFSLHRFDFAAYLLALSLIAQMIAVIVTALDVGKPFDGLISYYDPISNHYRINPTTPVWWANTIHGQFRSQDKLLLIDSILYRDAPDYIRKIWSEGVTSVTLTVERQGKILKQRAQILWFDSYKYTDLYLPSTLIAACLWVIAISVYKARPKDYTSRLIASTLTFGVLAYTTNRPPVFSQNLLIHPVGELITEIAIIMLSVLYLHTVFHLSRDHTQGYFRRLFVGGCYVVGAIFILSNIILVWQLWTTAWTPALGQAFEIHTAYADLFRIITPIMLCVRLVYYLWQTRLSVEGSPEVFRMRKVATALLLGTLISFLTLLPSPLSRITDGNATFFWLYLDFRMLGLFPGLMLSLNILRYQTFNARTRGVWFIPVVTLTALATSVIRTFFLSTYGRTDEAEIIVPSALIFMMILGISLFWMYLASLRGIYGRVLYGERRELRDVSAFTRKLADLTNRGTKPEHAIVEILQEQYQLEYVVLWKAHADLRGVVHFERAASDGVLSAIGSEPRILPPFPLDEPGMEAKAVRLNNGNQLPPPYYLPLCVNPAAEVALPVIFSDEPVAIIVVGKRRDKEILDNADLELLILFAQQSALFMDAQQVRERFARIGDILHDTTQQFMHQLTLEMTMIKESLEDHASDLNAISQMENLLEDIYENSNVLRQISTGDYQPGFVDVPRLIDRLGRRHKLKITYRSEVEAYISQNLQEEMYLWLREMLNNIIKHAQAEQVSVCMNEMEDALILQVQDDGLGIATPSGGIPKQRRGGLDRLRVRIERFKGTMTMKALQQGTQITVRVPLNIS